MRYVVLHRGGYGPLKWQRIERDLLLFSGALREIVRFEGDAVYELIQ